MGYGGTILVPRSPHGEKRITKLYNYQCIIVAGLSVYMEIFEGSRCHSYFLELLVLVFSIVLPPKKVAVMLEQRIKQTSGHPAEERNLFVLPSYRSIRYEFQIV
jgi:hypothetical protein